MQKHDGWKYDTRRVQRDKFRVQRVVPLPFELSTLNFEPLFLIPLPHTPRHDT